MQFTLKWILHQIMKFVCGLANLNVQSWFEPVCPSCQEPGYMDVVHGKRASIHDGEVFYFTLHLLNAAKGMGAWCVLLWPGANRSLVLDKL